MPKQHKAGPLLERIALDPLMISADADRLFAASVETVVSNEQVMEAISSSDQMGSEDDDFWPAADSWMADYRPYNVKDGVLQIPVMGTLLHRFTMSFGRWATGYKYIEMALKRGMADANVNAIAMVIDSPGGEVAGCFELCAKIIAASKEKKIRAFAADHAYSAAYAIACSCDQIIVTKSGGVGSVGVVTAHVEYSKMLEDMGIKVTFIFAGDHKVDGNSYEKLPKAVKDRIQVRINKIYGTFCSHVAEGRAMEEEDVRATNALTYDADEALEVGFADKIGALEDEMAIYADEASAEGDEYMAQDNVTGKKPAGGSGEGIDQATYDKGVADARAEGMAEGAKAERARINTILGSEEGKKRPKAALSTALRSDMTTEQAAAFLGDLAEEKPEAAAPAATTTTEGDKKPKAGKRDHFAEHMNNAGGAGVDNDGDDEGDDQDEGPKAVNSILSAFGAVSGRGPKERKRA